MKKFIFSILFFPALIFFFDVSITSAMSITGSGFGDANVNQVWTDNGASQCNQNTWTNASTNLVLSLDGGANGAGYTGGDCDTNWRIKPNLNSATNYYYRSGAWIGAYTISSGANPAGSMATTTSSPTATSTTSEGYINYITGQIVSEWQLRFWGGIIMLLLLILIFRKYTF